MSKDLTIEEENMSLEARSALQAVLLFHSGSPWDEEKRRQWEQCCNTVLGPIDNRPPEIRRQANEATTRVLCDVVRRALGL